MKEDQDLSTRVHGRVGANNTCEKGERARTWVRQVARAMEEQLKEDK